MRSARDQRRAAQALQDRRSAADHRQGPVGGLEPAAGIIAWTCFETRWGYAGLAASARGLCRFWLPMERRSQLARLIESAGIRADEGRDLLPDLQEQVRDYFDGRPVAFDCPLDVPVTPFGERIRRVCRQVGFGQTATYEELARRAGYARAARAVGNVMRCNQVPLIVPCHRVIRSDGQLGGFSAPAGLSMKMRLLAHEGIAVDRGPSSYVAAAGGR